jgi:hypothetical protein
MQPPEVATEQLQWLKENSPGRAAAQSEHTQYCSDYLPASSAQNVLFAGAERGDDFAHAMRLICQGHSIIAIDPQESAAARAIRRAWGQVIRARIEDSQLASCRFDLICEDYPSVPGQRKQHPAGTTPLRASVRMPGGA